MTRKRAKKKFTAAKLVKAMARAAIGEPPPTRTVPDRKKRVASKQAKHKPTLGDLLAEE
jgi:hypothetical protein